MRNLIAVLEAACFTFAAWIASGFVTYAGASWFGRTWQVAFHCLAVLTVFLPLFRLYFKRPATLHPAAAAALALAFMAALDFAFVSPYFSHPRDLFLNFWDWQLPALLVIASVYAAGRRNKNLTAPT